jgi:outer membrane protein assembly factor BamB
MGRKMGFSDFSALAYFCLNLFIIEPSACFMDTAFIGVQGRVLALKKENGEVLWTTQLGAGFGDSFVSLASDGTFVFAHTRGQLFCLDASSGDILWNNELTGLGFGTASICALAGTTDSQSLLKARRKESAGS